MAARVVSCSQFFSWCCARRILKCRPLTRPTTSAFTTSQQRSLIFCSRAPRIHTKCLRKVLGGCRSFSLGDKEEENNFNEAGGEKNLNRPFDATDLTKQELDSNADSNDEASSISEMHLDTIDLTDQEHDFEDDFDDDAWSTNETHLDTTDPSERRLRSSHPHAGSASEISDSKSESRMNKTQSEDFIPSTSHSQSNQSNTDTTASQEDSRGTLDLSDLTWSDDGIVIYPEIHFGSKKKKEKPKLTTWKDKTAKRREYEEYNIQNLLQNIQKSRAKKDQQLVVRERRTTVMTAEEMVEFLRQENARDIVVIELPPDVDYVRYFIVCSGMGSRHIGRMADNLVAEMRGVRLGKERRKIRVEGRDSEDWMAVDLGGMVVHFMLEEVRRKYELEKLWALGEQFDDQSREMKADMLSEEDLMLETMLKEDKEEDGRRGRPFSTKEDLLLSNVRMEDDVDEQLSPLDAEEKELKIIS